MLKLIHKVNEKLINRHRLEKKVKWGKENQDKIFYIIRLVGGGGLFSYIITIIGRINYAIEHGYIPIVDMQNYRNAYLTDRQIGNTNAWEFYFEQPMGYSLNDVKKSKNILLSDSSIIEFRPRATMDCLNNKNGIMTYWRKIVHEYLKINEKTSIAIESEKKRIFSSENRVLGVICRGTDYITLKPKGHWVQPDIKDVITKAKDVMSEQNCQKIFLATEDKTIFDEFVRVFGKDNILTNDKKWIDYKNGYINEYSIDRDNDNYLKGLEYFTTIYLLSKCNCLIGGRAGGTVGAMIMSDGYEYQYFWDLGVY